MRRFFRFAAVAAVTLAAGLLTAPAVTAVRAIDPCSGAVGCRIVKVVDVDGDGRADQVGVLVAQQLGQPGWVRVRVARAVGGRLLTASVRLGENQGGGDPWLGAAGLDAVPGAELVFHVDNGAHLMCFSALTYRRGGLVLLAAPPAAQAPFPPGQWMTDAAYSFALGVQRYQLRGAGYVTVRAGQRTFNAAGNLSGTFKMTITTYEWVGSRWVRRVSFTAWWTAEAALRVAGWHVAGLPVFPAFDVPGAVG